MSKLLLNPPGKDAPAIVRSLWLASGPGRAWVILEWARGIDKRDTRYALARKVATEARAIQKHYAKGAIEFANKRIDKLSAVMAERTRTRKRSQATGAKGGTKGAIIKKQVAAKWQKNIETEATRLIGIPKLTDQGIATRLAPDTATKKSPPRGVEAVRKHVARIRKAKKNSW